MALLKHQLEILAEITKSRDEPLKMLSFGYPDLLVESSVIEKLFGPAVTGHFQTREDSTEILNWHGFSDRLSEVIDSDHFFSAINVEAVYVDIVKSRNVERLVDLNEPLPDDLIGQFDFVLDPGTIEHCCNIGQALKNIAAALKPDGRVCHSSPLSMFNHGFYNINPTLFVDFYGQNNFEIEFLAATTGDRFQPNLISVPETERFTIDPEASTLFVARRNEISPLIWPIQSKYLQNPTLKSE
ncbi:MAG: class I SAM-dependent methyltransferase [Rhodospirillaceae bacterium]|nr:class I SAM-dependent methyltransferase [Rhodospirillaceae bacterium]